MFSGSYEDRLRSWHDFRNSLENNDNPIQETINNYDLVSKVSIHTDPYDQNTWPDPWELISENTYCEFCTILGICYTLQLTDRFSGSKFEIHITLDREKSSTDYLLFIDEWCINYDKEAPILVSELPKSLTFEKSYDMSGYL